MVSTIKKNTGTILQIPRNYCEDSTENEISFHQHSIFSSHENILK